MERYCTVRSVVLIGMMGAGKTAVGRRVASLLGWPFVDTDEQVESRTGKAVARIFETDGEAAFRDAESRVVAEAARRRPAVIAAGGGVVLREENVRRLAKSGWLVWLRPSVDALVVRVRNPRDRPLLHGNLEERVAAILAQREPLYARADIQVDVSEMTVDEAARVVLHEIVARERRTVEVNVPGRPYAVHVGAGILASVGYDLQALEVGPRLAVLTHAALWRRYGGGLRTVLSEWGFSVAPVLVRPGEPSKSLRVAERVVGAMAAAGLDRTSALVALGGGVVGDLAGFVAALYMRGIGVVQVPTTLLAQVDAAIGGKVAVNHRLAKNLIGTFHQPRLVVCDVATLASLPAREMRSGLAEVIKYGVIADPELFAFAERHLDWLLVRSEEALVEIVERCAAIKARVVAEDERETGARLVLNYGHTVGHALEAATAYRRFAHGEAIAVGMTAAAEIAVRLGVFDRSAAERQRQVLAGAGLPTNAPGVDPGAVLDAMRLDKKGQAGRPRWVLPVRIGEVAVRDDVPDDLAAEAVRAVTGGVA